MAKQYSEDFSQSIIFSREEAIRLHNATIHAEHFILGILKEHYNRAAELIEKICADKDSMIDDLETHMSNMQTTGDISTAQNGYSLEISASRALKDAIDEAVAHGDDLIRSEHLLLAILKNKESHACRILNQNGIDYETVSQSLSAKPTASEMHYDDDEEDDEEMLPPNQPHAGEPTTKRKSSEKESETPFLDKYGTDITQNAAEKKLDKVVGREKEIERIAQILSRRKKNNPILIGEPGVGKTAIVEGLAERIVSMKVPSALLDKRIIALDMSSLIAGTKYRGQFEERIMGVIKELTTHNEIILFIDEIHTLVGAGSAAGSMDAANILKPALSRGTLQCIGATTIEEYRKTIEKDGALERRFQKIIVDANTSDETLEILKNIKDKYEEHHHVRYTDEALEACVKLTDRYITERSQPDKAIDALDEAGSRVHLGEVGIPDSLMQYRKQLEDIKNQKYQAVKGQDFEHAANLRDLETRLEAKIKADKEQWEEELSQQHKTVTLEDVENTVSLMSGVPVQRMAKSESIRIKGLNEALLNTVVEQNEAIEKLVKAIMRNRIGLRDPNKPIGTFMFMGPTGVGKTYLAEKLAEYMFGSKDALIRIDMSEYMEKYSTSRLVGAPPGYVGYDEGGQLTEQVRRRPYSIVLLDEIEKASHDVFNILLQVMDEGRLTDSTGVTVDFKNTIIIFTSNSGSREVSEFGRGIGFLAKKENDKELSNSLIMKSLNTHFAPEFINRLDEIIMFNPLTKKSIEKIAKLELEKLKTRIAQLGYKFVITPKAMEFLVDKGFDSKYGARPLKRAIQTYIENGLGSVIMEDRVAADHIIHISKHTGKDELTFK